MAKQKKETGADIDWYLISVDRLKQLAALIVLVCVVLGGYFFWRRTQTDPEQKAQRAVSGAKSALDELAKSKKLNSVRAEFNKARSRFDEAQGFFDKAKFPEAEAAAIEAEMTAKAALAEVGTSPDANSDASFLTVEGSVKFQKGGSGDWKTAESRVALFNGDWVKTGDNASAELIFSNGSLYTVGSNALLEIFSAINPASNKRENTLKMEIGTVEINTTDAISKVSTPGSQVVIDSESTAQVGVDKAQKGTQVVSLRGSSSIASAAGGDPIKIATGERVKASKEGTISGVTKILPPPVPKTPIDNHRFQGAVNAKIDFEWNPQPAVSGYRFQVSRSRLFSIMVIDTLRKQTTAAAKVTSEGVFYWRVASVDTNGEAGPFSPFRRFRVTGLGGGTNQNDKDKTPPVLQLKRPFNLGQFYMIEGKTEPGASVSINDQEVDVDSAGAFKKLVGFDKVGWNIVVVKAVDPAGNPSIKRENVLVEE